MLPLDRLGRSGTHAEGHYGIYEGFEDSGIRLRSAQYYHDIGGRVKYVWGARLCYR